jgi:hypothetical protein
VGVLQTNIAIEHSRINNFMNKTILVSWLAFLLFAGNISSQNLKKGLKQITPELLEQHINYLASDSLKGRNTPSAGLDQAADYIAAQFTSMGIQKVNGSWFQNMPLITKNLDIEKCLFKFSKGEESKTFSLKTDYIPFEMTADTMVRSSLVFAGYGITAPEYNYDDYKGLDVRGKIVLVMKHEPGEKDSTSLFNGKIDTKHSLVNTKVENAIKHGAIGLLVVTDPLNHMLLTPQGYPWPGLSKFLPQDNLPVDLFTREDHIPVIQIGETVVKFLFGSIDTLKNIQKRIDNSLIPSSFQIVHTECHLSTRLKITNYIAKNVIGILESRDVELKKEYVVIGGHYDHVGFMKKYKDGEDYIYNGADDNASGTAGVLAIAKAFASMKTKPERSVVFILFAGEELGLFGSKYYCENPLVPVEKTVAMLNLDMISRNGHDTLQLDGLKQNPDMAEIISKEAKKMKFINIEGDEDLFKRSDHYNFFKKGISAMDITSGLHNDYHTVRDNPDSVDPEKAARISALTFTTSWIIANEKKYYRTVSLSK